MTNLAAMTSDDQQLAEAVIAREVAGYPRQRALARAFFRASMALIASLEGDEVAADIAFRRFRRHDERASRSAQFSGNRR